VIPEAERLQGNKPPYELAQFAPIALISADPVVLVVRDAAPWKNVREFVADARNRPAKITYSSSGIYGALHMPFTLLEHATGTTLWHVPYNGGGPALQALLGSQVDVTVGGPAIMIGQIKAKRLRPLASFGDKRLASLPDVPTLKELGIDAEYYIWAGLMTPAATPPAIQQALRNAVRQAVQDPDFRGAMAKIETPVTYLDAPEFREFWDTDAKRLAEAVKRTRPVEQKK
jgi:tripartite-type tricarboxylate transporter receptor subunit TctC